MLADPFKGPPAQGPGMKHFARLFAALDATTSTEAKLAALTDYLQTAPEQDRVWAVALLSGRRPKRTVNATELRQWAAQAAGIPLWLFEDSYAVAGDLAETIALVLPPAGDSQPPSLSQIMGDLARLAGAPAETRRAAILSLWSRLDGAERFLATKLITGGFRMGVSQGLMLRALARATGLAEADLAHRLMGQWDPAQTPFASLIAAGAGGAQASTQPYPFALAAPLENEPEALGPPEDWRAEWKWDGLRGQIVCRSGRFALWSRGEELLTDRFPEFAPLSALLPDGLVLDGEVVAWDAAQGRPLPFADLQKRIGRKTVPKKLLAEAPARFLAYDLLEQGGQDCRTEGFDQRRARLQALIGALPAALPIGLSPLLAFSDWNMLSAERARARDTRAEGVMLKRGTAPYHVGRKRGDWWKWKLDPWSVDAVMIYAQAGHGRRANLFTDFTFAIRSGSDLLPFTKAYSGLTDAEFAEITRWVQKNTLERFGPVRRVKPELVFEIAFEGIQESPRHKSGIALRFPRMARWRQDKPVTEIDTIDTLRALLQAQRN